MKTLLFRPAAAADLEEAWRWYEEQRPSPGHEFLDQAEAAVGRIVNAPQAYAVVYKDRRRALLQRFPYGVVYRLVDEQVVILAVIHAKPNPRVWRKRQ